MIVLVIDGEDYYEARNRGLHPKLLYCDVYPITSTSLIKAFAGVDVDYKALPTYREGNYEFIWEKLFFEGVNAKAFCIRIFAKEPIFFNTSVNKADYSITFPYTYEEMKNALEFFKSNIKKELKDADVLFAWIPFPDIVYHSVRNRHITFDEGEEIIKETYDFVFSVAKKEYVVFSDHGKWNGKMHERTGVIFTDFPDPPSKISQMYEWLLHITKRS